MELKEFYKFSWKKVIYTVVLAALIIIFVFYISCVTCMDHIAMLWELIPLYIFLWPSILISKIFNLFIGRSTILADILYSIIVFVINGFYLYTFSCLVDHLIIQVKKRK